MFTNAEIQICVIRPNRGHTSSPDTGCHKTHEQLRVWVRSQPNSVVRVTLRTLIVEIPEKLDSIGVGGVQLTLVGRAEQIAFECSFSVEYLASAVGASKERVLFLVSYHSS